ncbi:MAG: glucose PTS transporter subunit IIA [Streptococcaceae bacterium]|jgi:PTS system arbutin-like IIC component|nr:glucose PTS transporter subunit IIA [Streptococcaceae bacterium]
MKEKFQESTQKFSKAIIQPVLFLAVTGLFVAFSAIAKMDFMPSFIREVGSFIFGVVSGGGLGSLSVIFAVGLSASLAKKKAEGAIVGITSFMIFLFANNAWLTLTNRLAVEGDVGLYGTGQNYVMGLQVNDMGVFLGIIIGIMVGFLVNKFGDVKFHKYLAPYEGTRFAYGITIIATIFLAIAVTYVWPFVNGLVNGAVGTMNSMGSFGFFFYGFLNRMLLPLGMHHLLWMPLFYTPLGGTATIAGEQISGAANIWLAQLGHLDTITQMDRSIGFLVNFGASALPIGISLAFLKTAKKENRAKVLGIVVPTVIGSIMAGITEPIEFLFLFLSPVLWVAHAVIYGLGFLISNIAGINVLVGNLFETVQSLVVPMHLGHQYMIIPVFLLLVLMEFGVFTILIEKLNIPTVGRETMLDDLDETASSLGKSISADNAAGLAIIARGLGGVNNIVGIENCFTRLRLEVKDENLVDINLLKTYPSSGVVDKKKNVQIIVGMGVESVKDNFEAYVSQLKAEGKTGLEVSENVVAPVIQTVENEFHVSMNSVANGQIVSIEEVNDEVFASKALGNGYAIKNHDGNVYAPVNGKVTDIFPTKHAIGIKDENGQQILIHMGIDTVEMNGNPFNLDVQVGQNVTRGQLIAKMDQKEIQIAGKEDTIIVVAMENLKGRLVKGNTVKHSDLVFEV